MSARRTDAPGAVNLKVAISPSPNRVSLALSAQEPAGGLIARLAQLPDLPPIDISLNGEGPLDNFVAKLVARAGEGLGAQGDATITRVTAGRRVEFDLASQFAPLLPKALADLFADGAKLRGAAVLADDGAATLDNLALENSALGSTPRAASAPIKKSKPMPRCMACPRPRRPRFAPKRWRANSR